MHASPQHGLTLNKCQLDKMLTVGGISQKQKKIQKFQRSIFLPIFGVL